MFKWEYFVKLYIVQCVYKKILRKKIWTDNIFEYELNVASGNSLAFDQIAQLAITVTKSQVENRKTQYEQIQSDHIQIHAWWMQSF